jgi:FkbM family methyltransferase
VNPVNVNFSAISNRSLAGRILRLPLSWIPPDSVLPILQGPLRGKKWIVGANVHGCWLGSYESAKQLAIARMLNYGDVFYDIGANVGFYTLLASFSVGTSGKVFSFEPLPRNAGLLRRHLALNAIKNAQVFEAAVADVDGISRFSQSHNNSEGRLAESGEMSVKVIALDSLLDSMPRPTHIKIDIEGAELRALQGAEKTFRLAKPVLFLATHGKEVHEGCCTLLNTWGYTLTSIDGQPVSPANDEIVAIPD